MRYFLHLSYQGTNYQGYQRQPNALGVQQVIEETLSEVLNQTVVFSGCGRTDAGVHASQYFGSIDLLTSFPESRLAILNRRLPEDISVHEVIPVAENASPRFDATFRSYDYFIHLEKQAGLAGLSTLYRSDAAVDTAAMQSALAELTGLRDFRAYCKTPDRHNTTLCNLKKACLSVSADGKFLRIHFTANRFLRGMIRLLVGNLLRVGEGRLSAEAFISHLENKQPPDYFHLAEPTGLYLSGIAYPYLSRENLSPLHGLLNSLTSPLK
jgi:tRNA pseudouridine38-40 synthase